MDQHDKISVTKFGKDDPWSIDLSNDEIAFTVAGDPTRHVVLREDFHVKLYTSQILQDQFALYAPVPKQVVFQLSQDQFNLVNQYLGSSTKAQLKKYLKIQAKPFSLILGSVVLIHSLSMISRNMFEIFPTLAGAAFILGYLLNRFVVASEVLLVKSIFTTILSVVITYILLLNSGSPWWGWLVVIIFLFSSKSHWNHYKRWKRSLRGLT